MINALITKPHFFSNSTRSFEQFSCQGVRSRGFFEPWLTYMVQPLPKKYQYSPVNNAGKPIAVNEKRSLVLISPGHFFIG